MLLGLLDTLLSQTSHVNQGVDSGVGDPEIVAFTGRGTAKCSVHINPEGDMQPLLAVLLHLFCDLHRNHISNSSIGA